MIKPSEMKLGNLKKAWEEYGHKVAWEDLVDFKFSPDGAWVALAWREGNMIYYADLEWDGVSWDMVNDGGPGVTEEYWVSSDSDALILGT